MKQLQPSQLRKMIYDAQLSVKDYSALLAEARDPQKDYVVWELYSGLGRVTETINKVPGCRAEKFGITSGWDFSNAHDRMTLLKRLKTEEPDEVLMSPECALWSQLQELSASWSDEARQKLISLRAENHDVHLMFCAVVYNAQLSGGRHATIEHPANSKAWQTRAFKSLKGYPVRIDQCELGLAIEDVDGIVKPVQKPTILKTTKSELRDHIYGAVPMFRDPRPHAP